MEARGLYIIRKVPDAGYSRDPPGPEGAIGNCVTVADRSMGRRNRIIPFFGGDLQPFFVHDDFDRAVSRAAGRGCGAIAQSVLIPSLVGDLRVGIFDGIAREFGIRRRAARGPNVFGEEVGAALVGDMELFELLVTGKAPLSTTTALTWMSRV